MRFFILGANGRTGNELIDLALARGHQVTAFVRSPEKITRQDARLRVVTGDPHDPEAMAKAMEGHDAVLSALGPKPGEAFRGTTLLRDCATSTVSAMKSSGVARILFVSSAVLFPRLPLILRLFPILFRHHVEDLQKVRSHLEGERAGLDGGPAAAPGSKEGRSLPEPRGRLLPGPFQMSFRAVACSCWRPRSSGCIPGRSWAWPGHSGRTSWRVAHSSELRSGGLCSCASDLESD